MSADTIRQPSKGKGSLWYLHYPILGLASDEEGTIVTSGGGGAASFKEVPNAIEAQRVEGGQMVTVANLNLGKQLCNAVSYCQELKLYICSIGNGTSIYTLGEEDEFAEKSSFVTEKSTELPKGEVPLQNCTHMIDTTLVTGGTDGVPRIWSIQDGRKPVLVKEFKGHEGEIKFVQLSPELDYLASCGEDRSVRIWNLQTGEQKHIIRWEEGNVKFKPSHAIWREGELLILAYGVRGPSKLRFYEMKDGELKQKSEHKVDDMPSSAFAVNSLGDLAVAGIVNGSKKLFSLPDMRLVKQAKEVHDMPASGVTFSESDTVVSVSGDYSFHYGPTSSGGGGLRDQWVTVLLLAILLALIYNLAMKMAKHRV